MSIFTVILLALCLATDAFAVSISNGMCSCKLTAKNALVSSVTFGIFQALMPVLGYFLGQTFSDIISSFQHWVALLLLSFIGINMIVEAYKERNLPQDECCNKDVFTPKNIILQGIATSIDALAAGVSFAMLNFNILTAALIIGSITFICCMIGIHLGRKFGALLGLGARFVGGGILIMIGLKIFIENQFHFNFF